MTRTSRCARIQFSARQSCKARRPCSGSAQHVHHVIGWTVVNTSARHADWMAIWAVSLSADFAHMILSGSWRRMNAGRGQRSVPFFVDWNLGDAAQLIFDRIFNGDDLVFVGLDSLTAA